jgi:O-antigen ligase
LTNGYFNHIYLSAYSLLSVALLLQFKPVKNKLALFAAISILILNIGLLGSRAVVIGMILAAVLYAITMAFIRRKNIKYLLALLGVFLLATGIIYRFKDTLLFNRYAQVFEWYDNKDVILERNYSINNRIKLYFVGFSMFQDYHRYGINGTGLTSDVIAHKYARDFSDDFTLNTNTYNAHNQYITNFIDWGLTGLLLTFFMLFMPIRACLRSKKYWVAFYWISFSVILLMESALIRHRGIVVFVLFYSLFALPKQTTSDEPR